MNVKELFDLEGKVALVTGGARNLGHDMALALAEAGADVAITSRALASAEEGARSIRQATGRRVVPLALDVTDEAAVEAVVARMLADLGRIDILVNNAGNVPPAASADVPFEDRPVELWHQVIALNLTGAFLCAKHVVRAAMIPAGGGNIINLGSSAGIIGKDRRQYEGTGMGGATVDYHAAKGGVISMTRDMAVYLAKHGIRVNCISPGGFARRQPAAFIERYSANVPLGRMGEDGKELKGAVVFLASEASSYVTGHNLVVDGGLTAW